MKKKLIKNIRIVPLLISSFVFVGIVFAATEIIYTEKELGKSYQNGGWTGTEGISPQALSSLIIMNQILRERGVIEPEQKIGVVGSTRGHKDNANVGGSSGSKHLTGEAFDLKINPDRRNEYFKAAQDAGFGGFGFKSDVMHVDTRSGFQYWCYRSSDNNGSKNHCTGGKKVIAEDYLGRKLAEVTTAAPEPSGGFTGDASSGYSIDLKESSIRLKQQAKEELKKICSRDYSGIANFDGGICEGSEPTLKIFMNMIQGALNWIIGIAFMVALVVFLWAGFLLMTSGGDTGKRTKARGILINVVIGLILIASAWMIVDWMFSLFGVDDAYKFTSVK